MTVNPSIDPARLLEEQLAQASPDLLRELGAILGLDLRVVVEDLDALLHAAECAHLLGHTDELVVGVRRGSGHVRAHLREVVGVCLLGDAARTPRQQQQRGDQGQHNRDPHHGASPSRRGPLLVRQPGWCTPAPRPPAVPRRDAAVPRASRSAPPRRTPDTPRRSSS